MNQFFSTIVAITVIMLAAEFGDKTNLVALSLMSKSQKPFTVALGATIGISFVSIIAVLIGYFIGDTLPLGNITIFAGIIFIMLGILTLRGEDEDEEEESGEDDETIQDATRMQIIVRAISLVALAEIGDKSQIFIITASASSIPYAVLIGSVLGMAIIMFATALVGQSLLTLVDEEHIELVAGLLFIIAGIWIILSSFL